MPHNECPRDKKGNARWSSSDARAKESISSLSTKAKSDFRPDGSCSSNTSYGWSSLFYLSSLVWDHLSLSLMLRTLREIPHLIQVALAFGLTTEASLQSLKG
ncbi:hypothetical protein V6N13_113569 [Hibiscus sabdariffa]